MEGQDGRPPEFDFISPVEPRLEAIRRHYITTSASLSKRTGYTAVLATRDEIVNPCLLTGSGGCGMLTTAVFHFTNDSPVGGPI
jgi:hypothetical protein